MTGYPRDALLVELAHLNQLTLGTVDRLQRRGLTRLSEVAALAAADLVDGGGVWLGKKRYQEIREICIEHGFWRDDDPDYPADEPRHPDRPK
jgi:hypothetical protein